MTSRERTSVTDSESRHNLHVTQESDLLGIGPRSKEQLCAAIERADAEGGGAVVIDYGRERLYLAETGNIRYLPPTVLGFAEAPGLRVEGSRYAPMIDQFKSRTESLQQTGDQAQQRVTLTGLNDRTVTYQFELSVCDEEPFENCWPTDSVLD